MRSPRTLVLTCLLLGVVSWGAASPVSAQAGTPTAHTLETSDGVRLPGWEYRSSVPAVGYIVLFHQGGASGRGEYAPIVPRLLASGYHALVIDQRRGGTLFGAENSVSPRFDAEVTSYCDAYPDLEAALDFALTRSGGAPTILWGSSYSAALVIQLAARRADDVSGVLAFSPASGDPMAGCEPELWASRLADPLFAARPATEFAIESVRTQLERLGAVGATTWIADPGQHGSSMLVEDRVGAPTDATWAAVEAFLDSVVSSGRRRSPSLGHGFEG